MVTTGGSITSWCSTGIPKPLVETIDIDMEEMKIGPLLQLSQPSISMIWTVSMLDGHPVSIGTETGLAQTLIMDPKTLWKNVEIGVAPYKVIVRGTNS